jgi:hypothetical protein
MLAGSACRRPAAALPHFSLSLPHPAADTRPPTHPGPVYQSRPLRVAHVPPSPIRGPVPPRPRGVRHPSPMEQPGAVVHNEQASPIFEGVMEIQINSHLVRKITWQHDTREPHRYHEWPPFALTIKKSSRVHRTLVSSSTRKPRRVVRGWPEHYPNVIREVQWGVIQLSDRRRY